MTYVNKFKMFNIYTFIDIDKQKSNIKDSKVAEKLSNSVIWSLKRGAENSNVVQVEKM